MAAATGCRGTPRHAEPLRKARDLCMMACSRGRIPHGTIATVFGCSERTVDLAVARAAGRTSAEFGTGPGGDFCNESEDGSDGAGTT
jgi:hypothetical protein